MGYQTSPILSKKNNQYMWFIKSFDKNYINVMANPKSMSYLTSTLLSLLSMTYQNAPIFFTKVSTKVKSFAFVKIFNFF